MDVSLRFPVILGKSNLYADDYQCFMDEKQLTSECINFYFNFIAEKYSLGQDIKILDPSFVSLIYAESDQEDLQKMLNYQQLHKYRYLFIPINDT